MANQRNRGKVVKRSFSDFTYEFLDGNILVLYELDMGHRSLTNDLNNVIKIISEIEQVDLQKYPIAYQDSMGRFGGVKVNGNAAEIYSINGKSKDDAISYFKR